MCIYVCMNMWVQMSLGARERVLDPLELELEATVICQMLVLETKHGSSAGAVLVFNGRPNYKS